MPGHLVGKRENYEFVLLQDWVSFSSGQVRATWMSLTEDNDGRYVATESMARIVQIEECVMLTDFQVRSDEPESFFLAKLGKYIRTIADLLKHDICLFSAELPQILISASANKPRRSSTASGAYTPPGSVRG